MARKEQFIRVSLSLRILEAKVLQKAHQKTSTKRSPIGTNSALFVISLSRSLKNKTSKKG